MKKIMILVSSLLVVLGIEVIAASYYQIYLPVVFQQGPPTLTSEPPTPTATPFPEEVQILPSVYIYESGGMLHVVGEVLNNTSFSLYFVEIYIRFYNALGEDVGVGSTVMEPFNLPARERGCFMINMDIPLNWKTYKFDILLYEIDISSPDLIILASNGDYIGTMGDYIINGWVRNDGSQLSSSVSVGGTLYNPADVPVGCEDSIINIPDLRPDEISDFTIQFSGDNRDYADVNDYRLRVTGNVP